MKRVLWTALAVIFGVIAMVAIVLFALGAVRGGALLSARGLAALVCGIAAIYAARRMMCRAAGIARPLETRSASGERLVAAIAAAVLVMTLSFAIAFIFMDAALRGAAGLVVQAIETLGHGLTIAGLRVGLRGPAARLALETIQFVLLATFFYLLGTWWAQRGDSKGQSNPEGANVGGA